MLVINRRDTKLAMDSRNLIMFGLNRNFISSFRWLVHGTQIVGKTHIILDVDFYMSLAYEVSEFSISEHILVLDESVSFKDAIRNNKRKEKLEDFGILIESGPYFFVSETIDEYNGPGSLYIRKDIDGAYWVMRSKDADQAMIEGLIFDSIMGGDK